MPAVVIGLVLLALVTEPADIRRTLAEADRRREQGDTAGALDSFRSALEQSPPGSPERGDTLVALAGLESAIGRYADADRHARQAADIYRAIGDLAGVSAAMNRAGLAAQSEGRYDAAAQAIGAALEASARSGDQDARAEQLGNLANIHFYTGRYADASRLYKAALAITEVAHGAPWALRRRRILLVNQATLHQRLGQNQDALAIYKSLDGTDAGLAPREQAQLLVNLGVLYRRLGDPVKALDSYDRARALFARDRHVDGELSALKNRGIVLALDLARLDAAARTFSEALAAATAIGNRREMLHAHVYRGETSLRAGRRDAAREDFAAALDLAQSLRTPEEEWKALYGLGRLAPDRAAALVYLRQAVATIEQIRDRIGVPSMRLEFLGDKRVVYDALIARHLATATPSAVFELLERSHSRGWRDQLGLPAAVDLRAVQRALAPRTLLLDYWSAPEGSAVVAVTSGRAAVVRVSVDPRAVSQLIDDLAANRSAGTARMAAAAAALLPGPEWFEGIEHVIIVPDGPVALVPFDVLPILGGPLVRRAATSYLPTAGALLRSPSPGPQVLPPWHLELRVFADPVFTSASLDDARVVRRRLEGSRDEAQGVAAEIAGRSELHLGAENLKAHLVDAHETAPLLHLATHALADANAIEQSRILFSGTADDPGGADYLFVRQAYELPLAGVELAVLSACDTERGRLVRGEGVQSFSRAFLAAGARSTVTTLWQVADRPTADFMRVFYHHLQRGVARDEALRRAKLRFLDGGTSLAAPHYWAAYVLSGDAVRPVPRALSWSLILALAATILVVSAVAIRWKWRPAQKPVPHDRSPLS